MRILLKLFELRMPEVQLGGGGSGVSVVVGLLLAGEPGVAAARVTAVAAAKPPHLTLFSSWNVGTFTKAKCVCHNFDSNHRL